MAAVQLPPWCTHIASSFAIMDTLKMIDALGQWAVPNPALRTLETVRAEAAFETDVIEWTREYNGRFTVLVDTLDSGPHHFAMFRDTTYQQLVAVGGGNVIVIRCTKQNLRAVVVVREFTP